MRIPALYAAGIAYLSLAVDGAAQLRREEEVLHVDYDKGGFRGGDSDGCCCGF